MVWTRCVALILIVSLVSGCTTYRVASIQGSPQGAPVTVQEIEPGDKVRVTLNSGEVREFSVTAVDADRISGDGEAHNFSDIKVLEVRRADESANATIVAVAAIMVFLTFLLLDEFGDAIECIGRDDC